WLRVTVDTRVPAIEGSATPAGPQSYTVQLEPTLFVDHFQCRSECNADGFNAAHIRAAPMDVRSDALVRATTIQDITNARQERSVLRPAAAGGRTRADREEHVAYFTVEDLGFEPQPPSSTFAVAIDAALQAPDGQTLGYRWIGIVENWHAT